jgi:hypothetical protein
MKSNLRFKNKMKKNQKNKKIKNIKILTKMMIERESIIKKIKKRKSQKMKIKLINMNRKFLRKLSLMKMNNHLKMIK